jgi:hypothetical protein
VLRDPVDGGVVQLIWRAPELDVLAGDRVDQLSGRLQLVGDLAGRQRDQRDVRVRVVFDGADPELALQVAGPQVDVAPHDEEGCALAGLPELLQRVVGVDAGTIIERECDLVTVRSAAVDRQTEAQQARYLASRVRPSLRICWTYGPQTG